MEEEAQLTCQAELLLAKVVLDETAHRLQEIEHLCGEQNWCCRSSGEMTGVDGE